MELFGVGFVFLLFFAIALLTVAWKTIKIVPQSSVLLIERLGRFHRIAASGLNIIVPFFEAPRTLNEPLRCKHSAFKKALAPISVESFSSESIGVGIIMPLRGVRAS